LVSRRDPWGCYRPGEDVGRAFVRADGTAGRLGAQTTARGRLTRRHLVRHFRPRGRADILGLHPADAGNLARWGALDIDWHGPRSAAPEVNRRAALAWYAGLARRGFRPLLTTSNGRGGYHLRVLLAAPIPAGRL